MKSVLVSGFFNPNDKQLFDNDINLDSYFEFGKRFLALDNNIIIFTDKYSSIITDIRSKYDKDLSKTKIIKTSIQDFYLYKEYYSVLDKLLKEDYNPRVSISFSKKLKTAVYNIIQYSKGFLLEEAQKIDPSFDYYIWNDFGAYRSGEVGEYMKKWPNPFKLNKDKITFFNSGKVNIKDWKEEYTTYTNGGCIIVPSELIKEFVKRIKQALKLMIDSGYVVDDQRIYDWIAFNTDGLVAYQQCDWRKYTEHYN
tara:strand:- start:255 stop:1013 length:759 start_codon:yes stop_codon:yes gene_type:complete